MSPTLGMALKQARELRCLSAIETARAADISAAYLSKLEADSVKKPSPHVLHGLSEALSIPYGDLMRLSGYLVPGEVATEPTAALTAALFSDLTEEEAEELVAYLAWYRSRRRSGTHPNRSTPVALAPST